MNNHFWPGRPTSNTVAFIFSAPGRMEEGSGRPVTGDTGSNMDQILQNLNQLDPLTFPSNDRYDYLITNSSHRVLYAKKDNGQTEDKIKYVTAPKNIERVLKEIGGCSIVILCGKRAQKLQKYIEGKKVIVTFHFGNKGLRNHYPNRHQEMIGLDSKGREAKRRQLCAELILSNLQSNRGASLAL